MKLISDEAINKAVEEAKQITPISKYDFLVGAAFSEKELEKLAIEFALWIGGLDFKLKFDQKLKVWKSESANMYPTTVLFNKFIEQRNNKK